MQDDGYGILHDGRADGFAALAGVLKQVSNSSDPKLVKRHLSRELDPPLACRLLLVRALTNNALHQRGQKRLSATRSDLLLLLPGKDFLRLSALREFLPRRAFGQGRSNHQRENNFTGNPCR